MNRQDRGILVGMVLGDGYIKTASAADKKAGRHPSAQIYFGHSLKQEKYAQHKLDLLNKMFKGNASLRFGKNGEYGFCYANKSNPYFKTLKGMMYRDGVKTITPRVLNMLTPHGVAIWFMDDGSHRVNKRSDGSVSSIALTIATYCSREEVNSIIAYFDEVHGIKVKPAFGKGAWSIRMNTSAARQFAKLVESYVIPEMKYKLSCVQDLDRHERTAPEDKICGECGKVFVALKAKGLCMNCYNRLYFKSLEGKTRTCSICSSTESAKWFVGDRCRSCYNRVMRYPELAGKETVRCVG